MRVESTQASDVQVVMGGELRDWEGWLLGIAEEALCSLKEGQLLLVLGGFGGCAGALAGFLVDPDAEWPLALRIDAAAADRTFSLLCKSEGAREQAERRFAALQGTMVIRRAKLHGQEEWPFPSVHLVQVQRLL
jgi:SLOG cluster2